MTPSLKHAYKSLKRYKAPTLINSFGFTIGLTGAILLLAILMHDLNFDKYHQNDNVYRMSVGLDLPSGARHFASTSVISAENLTEAIPEITGVIRMRTMPATLINDEDILTNEPITYVDSTFYNGFRVDLLQGVLPDSRDQILISSATRDRVFGDRDPIGKLLNVQAETGLQPLLVAGVYQSYPTNVSFRPSYLASFDLIEARHNRNHGAIMPYLNTFVVTSGNVQTTVLNEKISKYYESNLPDGLFDVLKHEVEEYGQMHFRRGLEFDLGQKHDRSTLWILGILSTFILLSTVINYFNIQMALAVQRTKELSIRKALGQSFLNKLYQTMSESALLLLPSFIIAGISIHLLLIEIEAYTGQTLTTGWLASESLPFLLLALFVVFWMVSLSISMILLKTSSNNLVARKSVTSKAFISKGLIGLQFALAGFFILSAMVISKQLKFIDAIDMGYEPAGLLNVSLNVPTYEEAQRVKTVFQGVAGIQSATVSQSSIFGEKGKAQFSIEQDTGAVSMLVNYNYIDKDFLATNQLRLVAGSNITEGRNQVLINEKAVKTFGYSSAEEILNKKIDFTQRGSTIEYTVGGVISNYHYATMRQMIEPIVLLKNEGPGYYNLSLKTEGRNVQAMLPALEATWDKLYPGYQFNYRALTEVMENDYAEDAQKGRFYQWATYLLVVIAALGIFGLTYHYADQKRKEIGIRKAIGARLLNILLQIGNPILWISGIAAAIAIPVAYNLSSEWLNAYQYRIEIGASLIITTIVIMFVLSAIAILYPGLRASKINPVDALREE
ncbi:FtsX-like permease family protein [Roseivirga sp.]|uniref:FtsX-like permease family protein n=1 Tax=Roseivirga sp. TaxID=1964215 RepID=UPI003B8D6CE7